MNAQIQDPQSRRALFTNGKFFSKAAGNSPVHVESPFLDSLLVNGGLIEHIGSEDDSVVVQARQAGVPVYDMRQRTILPGFIDGHMHFLLLGQSLQKLSLEGCKSLEEIRGRIKEYSQAHPSAPRILCRGWMHSMTNGAAEASMLDDLDERPIFIDSKDLHSTWCNSAALAEMGVEAMPDPVGGSISRDASGKPSGLLSEAAVLTIIWPHIATVATIDEKLSALKAAIAAYNQCGYTGLIDMAMDENAWEALQVLRSKGEISVRIAAHWLITPSNSDAERLAQVDRAIALSKVFNAETSPDFRIVGIKVICDGVIDACTAALLEPYSSNTVNADPLWTTDMLAPVVKRADDAGLQCALHAIGDRAVRLAVDTLETCCLSAPTSATGERRHRIEHLELASPEDARRLGKLGITASIQPVHADPAILRAWPKLLGEERLGRAFAYKEFLDGGATLALGSDSPTAPHDPLRNIYTATTRRSAREPESEATVNNHFVISLCDAVSAATAGAAYSCFADKRTGSLQPGLQADFVVLDMEWEASLLLNASVKETWFGGEKVYDSGL